MTLSDLTGERKAHRESCRNNGDESHKIITDMYSDPSHFIYEFLQNADDVGATKVKFVLETESLSIIHNGKKLFNIEDVGSITTVGSSTKKDDVNSIGTFGAGFKSVFAITQTPRIHSGDFHFKISDFIVPEEIEPIDIEQEATQFILPFDHPNIAPDIAYERISDYLKELESESLLFLHNIKKIQWETKTASGHYSSTIDKNNNKASLSSQVNEGNNLIEYFLFKKNIEVADTKLNIVVAYQLDSDGAITPADNPKLFVFFPTKEITGFKFLVHAPYKTTPSRESIPFDDPQNQLITKHLSNLVAESIIELKNNQLLNVDVLSILPIDSKNQRQHPLYSSTFCKVKSIFANNTLLPTKGRGYKKSGNTILAREKALIDLLKSEDCSLLFKRSSWLSPDITYDRTRELRDYLVNELDIPEITLEKFCSKITKKFFKNKPDSWVRKFYSSIEDNRALYRVGSHQQKKGILRKLPIIRLENDRHINPEDDSGDIQVYLPTIGTSRFKTVKKALTKKGKSLEFLKNLGLKEPDNIAEIERFIIPKYQGECIDININEYTKDFKRVLEMWSQSDEYQKKKIVDLLKKAQFVRCVTNDELISYQTPEKVYFSTLKLSAWFNNNSVDKVYFLDSSIKISKQERKFIESLGVKYELKIFGADEVNINFRARYERSVNGFNPDFNIHGLEYSLDNITIKRSILLWQILLKNTNKLKGHTEKRTNQNQPYNRGQLQISKAMRLLTNQAWLYDNTEELFNEQIDQIALDDLNDEYLKEDENIKKLIEILGLKLDEIADFEERTNMRVVSKEDYLLLQEAKKTKNNEEQQDEEDSWTANVDPADATPIQGNAYSTQQRNEDLSNQNVTEGSTDSGQKNNDHEENSDKNKPTTAVNSKKIGDWGEAVAKKYLNEKYPEYEVVWLNQNGNTV